MSDETKSVGWGGAAFMLALLAALFVSATFAGTCAERDACRWTLDRYAKTPAETLAVLSSFPADCPGPKGLKK